MLRDTTVLSLLLMLLATPSVAVGQMELLPEGKWWQEPRIIKQLNLSQEQIDSLDQAAIEHSRKLIPLRSAVQQEQFELGVLVENPALDEDAILKQIKKLEKAKNALSTQFWRLIIDVKRIVGHDGFMKIKKKAEMKARQKMRRFIDQKAKRKGRMTPQDRPRDTP